MKFSVERNWIDVLGIIWMPAITAAKRIDLSAYDIENIGEATRENVERWLVRNAGDFQSIIDFHAIVGETVLEWMSFEHEQTFMHCMYGEED